MKSDLPVPESPIRRMWLDSSSCGIRSTRGATEDRGEQARRLHPAQAGRRRVRSIELRDADELGSLQPPPMPPFARPGDVLRHGDAQRHDADTGRTPERRCGQVDQRVVAIDPLTEEGIELDVVVVAVLPGEVPVPRRRRRVGQGPSRLARGVRCRLHFPVIEGEEPAATPVHGRQDAIPAEGFETYLARESRTEVRRKVEPLKRRPGSVAVRPHGHGRRDGHDERSERPHGFRVGPGARGVETTPGRLHRRPPAGRGAGRHPGLVLVGGGNELTCTRSSVGRLASGEARGEGSGRSSGAP